MYMRQLDGLRAFAILAVMVEHFGGKRLNDMIPVGAGTLGVDLFFTLSGFLITGILLVSFNREPSVVRAWWHFYARRFLRLAPVLYLSLSVLAIIGIGTFASSWPWHAAYLTNIYIARGGEKTVFWSLAVEEQFYLFWPFVIAFAPRRFLIPVCISMLAAGIAWKVGGYYLGADQKALNVLLPGSFEPLAVGCLLAVISYRNGKANDFAWLTPRAVRVLGIAASASLASTLAIWLVLGRDNTLRYFILDTQMAVIYGFVIIMAARGFGGFIGHILEHPVAVYIGRISYGLYVVHNFIPDIVERFTGPMPKVIEAPIVLALVFGICALSFRFIETPIRLWGHRKLHERQPPELVTHNA